MPNPVCPDLTVISVKGIQLQNMSVDYFFSFFLMM